MFSHQLYNVVHIVGLVLLVLALGGIALTDAGAGAQARRRTVLLLHGLGIFLILLGGFGMLARLGLVEEANWPGWIWVKLGVWGMLGAAAFVPMRWPGAARPLLVIVPLLAGLAAYMAIYKPF